jgi:hypothetical protein
MLQRRGSAAEWAASNPILGDGELGLEKDTHIVKLGDGVTAWNDLPSWFILRTLVDAKGDILVGVADNTVARLARGATGTHLEVQPDGSLAWVAMPAFALAADVVANYETIASAMATFADKTSGSNQVFAGSVRAPSIYDNGNRVYSLSNPPPSGADYTPYFRRWTKTFLAMGA